MGTQYTYNSGGIEIRYNWDLTGYQVQKVLEQETAPNQALEFFKRAIQYSSIINKINKVLESDYNAEYKQAAIAIILIKEFGGDVFLLANGQGALDLLQDAADIVKYYDENFLFFEENFPEDFYQSEGVLYVRNFDVPVDEIIENPEEYPAPAPASAPSTGTPVPEQMTPDQRPVSPTRQDTQNPYGNAKDAVSPLVLDLDGDGIELVALNDAGSVFWDIDEDGLGEATGWIAGGDGLLAVDLNEDGIINDHGELFGNDTTDGFSILSAYDSNTDDVITVGVNFIHLVPVVISYRRLI